MNLALETHAVRMLAADTATREVTWTAPAFRMPASYCVDTRDGEDGAWTMRGLQGTLSYAAPAGVRQVRVTPVTAAGNARALVVDVTTGSSFEDGGTPPNQYAYMSAASQPALPTSAAEALPTGWLAAEPAGSATEDVYRISRRAAYAESWSSTSGGTATAHPQSGWIYRYGDYGSLVPGPGDHPDGWTLGSLPPAAEGQTLWGARPLRDTAFGTVWSVTTEIALARTFDADATTAWAFDPAMQPWKRRLAETVADQYAYRRGTSQPALPASTAEALPSGWGANELAATAAENVYRIKRRVRRAADTSFVSATAWAFDPAVQPWRPRTGVTMRTRTVYRYRRQLSRSHTPAASLPVLPSGGRSTANHVPSGWSASVLSPDADDGVWRVRRVETLRNGVFQSATAWEWWPSTQPGTPWMDIVTEPALIVEVEAIADITEIQTAALSAVVGGTATGSLSVLWTVESGGGIVSRPTIRAGSARYVPGNVSTRTDVTVRCTARRGGHTAHGQRTFAVSPVAGSLTLAIAGSSEVVYGGTGTFTATVGGGSGAASYAWEYLGGIGSISPSNARSTTYTHNDRSPQLSDQVIRCVATRGGRSVQGYATFRQLNQAASRLDTPTLSGTAGNGRVVLARSSVSGAARYELRHKLSTEDATQWSVIDTDMAASKTVTGLANGVTHHFGVRAVAAAGSNRLDSSWSPAYGFFPQARVMVAIDAVPDLVYDSTQTLTARLSGSATGDATATWTKVVGGSAFGTTTETADRNVFTTRYTARGELSTDTDRIFSESVRCTVTRGGVTAYADTQFRIGPAFAVSLSGPPSISEGSTGTFAASLFGFGDLTGVTYRWYQTEASGSFVGRTDRASVVFRPANIAGSHQRIYCTVTKGTETFTRSISYTYVPATQLAAARSSPAGRAVS
ncbi:MAG: hypothetical protein OXG72_19690, partial [Acidobacteria bacterium]|nr:hypothetical protein [Acidobacteriota bacterium]